MGQPSEAPSRGALLGKTWGSIIRLDGKLWPQVPNNSTQSQKTAQGASAAGQPGARLIREPKVGGGAVTTALGNGPHRNSGRR